MHEREPNHSGDTDPTTADILYDAIQGTVEKLGPLARDRHITDHLANSDAIDESFVGFAEGEQAFSFGFHVDEADRATLYSLIAEPGYSEIGLLLWKGNEPIELDTEPENVTDNLYVAVLLEGQTPFLAKYDDIDGYLSAEEGRTVPHASKMAGAEHFLEMAKHGQATMRLLDDGASAELLEALSDPALREYVTSD